MPWCKIGNSVTFVDSAADCQAMAGGIVPGPVDAGAGDAGTDSGKGKGCFVRNVMSRAFGELILDLGVTEKVSPQLAANVDLPREPVKRGPSKAGALTLTKALRLRLTTRVMHSMLKLAATYKTGLECRVHIFLQTPRGRHLLDQYDHHLPEIYPIASSDYTLLNDLATAWLKVVPFIEAMVSVATQGEAAPLKARHHKLPKGSSDDAQDLVRRFGERSQSSTLKALTLELATELDEYRGLDAENALSKLRGSAAKRGSHA
jgi:hypothetical protein